MSVSLFTAQRKSCIRIIRNSEWKIRHVLALVGLLPVTGGKDSFLCFAELGFDR